MNAEQDALTKKELFLGACRCQAVPRVPVWMMRQAGRYLPEYRALRAKHSFLEVCRTPELAVTVSMQPYEILGVDAVIVFSDILIAAEAMGMQLEISDAGPVLANPVRDARDVAALRVFDPSSETRPLLDAIRGLRHTLGADVPILGFAGAPWTLACYMVEGQTKSGFEKLKKLRYSDPALLRQLLHTIARATAGYLRAQLEAGATAVQLFDTWAGELNSADYEQFALSATQQLIAELAAGDAPVILYSKGTSHLLPLLARSGAGVLSVDWRVNLQELRTAIAPHLAVQGNVDPCALLGSQDEIEVAVANALKQTGGLGHILNLGHGILPSVPVENAKYFVSLCQRWRNANSAAQQLAQSPVGSVSGHAR